MQDDFGTSPDDSAARIRRNRERADNPMDLPFAKMRVPAFDRGMARNLMPSFDGGGMGETVFMGPNGTPIPALPLLLQEKPDQPILKGEQRRESEGLDRGHGGIRMKLRVPPGQVAQPRCNCDIAISVIDVCHCPDLPAWEGVNDETKKAYDEKFQKLPAWQRAVCEAMEKRIKFLKANLKGIIDAVQPKGISDKELAEGRGTRRLGANRAIAIVNGELVDSGHQYFIAVLVSYDCECKCNVDPDPNSGPPCYAQFKVKTESEDKVEWEPDSVKGGYGPLLSKAYEGFDAFDRKRCYRAFVDSIGDVRDPVKEKNKKIGPAERRIKGIATVSRDNPKCKETAELDWVVKSDMGADGEPSGSLKKIDKAVVRV